MARARRAWERVFPRWGPVYRAGLRAWLAMAWLAPSGLTVCGQDFLSIETGETGVVLRAEGQGPGPAIARVETVAALDGTPWAPVYATASNRLAFCDTDSPLWRRHFYRVIRTPAPDILPGSVWTNRLVLPGHPFLSDPMGGADVDVRWVKFALLTDNLTEVYFQDSREFVFHYDFATNTLTPFLGMSRQAFDAGTLYLENQCGIMGAVLLAEERAEYAIQFVGQDAYPRSMVRFLYGLVDDAIARPGNYTGLYMPAPEQVGLAEADRAYFARHNVRTASFARWTSGSGIYSSGWAQGRLRFVPAVDVESWYRDGKLLPSDILLTDLVSAELPHVAGIVSFSPATPNSHVVLLAQAHGIPFVYLRDGPLADRANSLTNRLILLRLDDSDLYTQVDILPLDVDVPAAVTDYLARLKAPPEIAIAARQTCGCYSTNTAGLTPDHIRYVGGKAANFGFLRRAVPAHSPDAIAFTFDLWEAFMSQPATGGLTLAEEIDSRLAGYTYPPAMGPLSSDLQEIRDRIRYASDFAPLEKSSILAALDRFDPQRKVRFRSSTNAEDTDTFSGAGLYDSYSARPANPEDVFEAMRKVYAGFYNENAFLERLRHGIDEDTVGMAILAHHSFPDADELANGVATHSLRSGSSFTDGRIVSQPGAHSVTNPDGDELPEVVSFQASPWGIYPTHEQRSSLLIPGVDHVLSWPGEYEQLVTLLQSVAAEYTAFFTGKTALTLDFEYKKMRGDGLVIKQVREVPAPPFAADVEPVLLNRATAYRVFQGEYGTVFGNHYLKSRWTFETVNAVLDAAQRVSPWFTRTDCEYVSADRVEQASGVLTNWPGYSFSTDGGTATYGYATTSALGRTTHALEVGLPVATTTSDDAIRLLSDQPIHYTAQFPTGMPELVVFGQIATSDFYRVRLEFVDPDAVSEGDRLQTRDFRQGSVTVHTEFYWPPVPDFPTAGYTAPLVAFVETRILGLVREAVVLTGYYSQTYRPQHHNFEEDFLFEPGLDPGVPGRVLEALATAGIKQILLRNNDIRLIGFDGKVRRP